MKRMKRTGCILLSLALLFSIAGCGKTGDGARGNPFADRELNAILEDVYARVNEELPAMQTTEITQEMQSAYLGTTDLHFSDAIASEPMINAIAYSVCLVRMTEGEDIEAAKQEIRDNADPAKWICVQVDPQNIIVDSVGDIIILIMSDAYAQAIHDSFLELADA